MSAPESQQQKQPTASPSPSQSPPSNQPRRNLLSHISFGVRSYPISKAFYTAALQPLGASLVYDDPARKILGYGFDADHDHEELTIFESGDEARAPGPGTHFAFRAPSRECVRRFWEMGIKHGGTGDGAPGVRARYGERYFAAFVLDPDGFKLEAVFQGEGEGEGEGEGGTE
ncbi:hypothetical protein FQN52_007167 [Onygenales sp. PD_12]|nr:hypothetical protein FQN52_007167 [Onygenales sp. PD_12]